MTAGSGPDGGETRVDGEGTVRCLAGGLKRALADREARAQLVKDLKGRGGWVVQAASAAWLIVSYSPSLAGPEVTHRANRPAVGWSRAALHAKLFAEDDRIVLLGSANLTDKALAVNLELGVILHDPDIVGRIVRHFRVLMRPGSGILEPLPE